MTSGTKLFNVVDNLYNYNLDDFYKECDDLGFTNNNSYERYNFDKVN